MKHLAQSLALLALLIGLPLLIIRQLDFGRNFPYRGFSKNIGREIYPKQNS